MGAQVFRLAVMTAAALAVAIAPSLASDRASEFPTTSAAGTQAVERLPSIRPVVTPAVAPKLTQTRSQLPTSPVDAQTFSARPTVHSRALDAPISDRPTGIKYASAIERHVEEEGPGTIPRQMPEPQHGSRPLPTNKPPAAPVVGREQPAAYTEAELDTCRECGKSPSECRCAPHLGLGDYHPQIRQRGQPTSSGDAARPDNIIYDIMPNPNGGTGISAGGFGHPECLNTADPSGLPVVQ